MSVWPTDAGALLEWTSVSKDIWHYSRPEFRAVGTWQLSEDPGGLPVVIEYLKNDYGHLVPGYRFQDPKHKATEQSIACLYGIVGDRDAQQIVERNFTGEMGSGSDVALYGSLIGPGIDGNPFGLDVQEFALLDIKLGNHWLAQDLVHHYGRELSLRTSFLGSFSLIRDILEYIRSDYSLSYFTYPHLEREVPIRGVLLRPLVELQNSRCERVIASLRRNQHGVVS